MNYFRYLVLGVMLVSSGMPLIAAESSAPRASLFGRCYNSAYSWISSSFLVTRNSIKEKLAPLYSLCVSLQAKLAMANAKTENIEEHLHKLAQKKG